MSDKLSTIGQIAITVSDVEKALAFYRIHWDSSFCSVQAPNWRS